MTQDDWQGDLNKEKLDALISPRPGLTNGLLPPLHVGKAHGQLRALKRVAQQRRDGHGAHTPGHGRDERRDTRDLRERHVAHDVVMRLGATKTQWLR